MENPTMTELDNPQIASFLFYPRRAEPGSRRENVTDGTIPVGDGIALGYRLYRAAPAAPLVLLFHGNGEIAPDYDGIAPLYDEIGVSLLVVDYRGYGWSTGEPRVSTLLPDALAVHEALPRVLEEGGVEPDAPRFIMGRSLGSAPAIHLAHEAGDTHAGLIIESGFSRALALLIHLGLPADRLQGLADPFDNLGKMGRIDMPLLVIHGAADQLIPASNARELHEASPASDKRLLIIEYAGHNDLIFTNPDRYFGAISAFVTRVGTGLA